MSGVMESINNMATVSDATLFGRGMSESEIVLEAIRSQCDTLEEFVAVIESCAEELALHGVIDDATIATEAVKKLVIEDWKTVDLKRLAGRAAVRMAKNNNDTLYKEYRKYRDKLLEVRAKINKKYGAKAMAQARKIVQNRRNRAASMTSKAGKTITEKMDRAIAAANASARKGNP